MFLRRPLSPLFFGLHPQHVELTANTSTEFTLLHTLDSTKLCFLRCIFTSNCLFQREANTTKLINSRVCIAEGTHFTAGAGSTGVPGSSDADPQGK